MNLKFFITISFLFVGIIYSQAQTRSTKETKVVLIVSEKTNEILGMELFDILDSEKILPKKYPNNKFYLGIFKGNFELNENLVKPQSGATIIIYSDKQLFLDNQLSLNKGASIKIGKVKTEVISSKNGELILKTL